MVVYITGANGYLGAALTKRFSESGNHVVALCRKNIFNHPNVQFSYFSLGSTIDKNLPKPDICIHCAYDLRSTQKNQIFENNVIGSKLLIEQLSKVNCKSFIHISSISAFEGCKSKYGKAKLSIEKITTKYKGISIRPGLIYGGENSGLMGKLFSLAKLPIIPMIGSGNYTQYLTDIECLCNTIYNIANNKYELEKDIITLASTSPITLKKIIKGFNNNIIIIPIYWKIPYLILFFLETLHLNLPFKSDSIKSIVFSNKEPNFDFVKKNNIDFNT